MNILRLNIATPSGSAHEREDVGMAVLQTTAGETGIMCGHIPTVIVLKTGHVRVNFHNGNELTAVSDGFTEARQHQLSTIVQTAEPASETDVERAKLAKSRVESHLEEDDGNTDINRAKRAFGRANNCLRVAELQ